MRTRNLAFCAGMALFSVFGCGWGAAASLSAQTDAALVLDLLGAGLDVLMAGLWVSAAWRWSACGDR